MRRSTGNSKAVGANGVAFGSRLKHFGMTDGDLQSALYLPAESLEEAVMNKLDRLAAELRALGIEF